MAAQDGNIHRIDLSQDVGNRITKFKLLPSEMLKFRSLFDPNYLEMLDDGGDRISGFSFQFI
jgi:hypothetical protein